MEILERDAKEIVTEISKLLSIKMNIMDSRGFIIASSDEKRIGTFHAAAYEIIEKNLDGLEIETDGQWEGAIHGQNFPLRQHKKIIGVVGITGDPEETRKYGPVIRKMTEILVEGKAREEEKTRKETELSRFLVEWISGGEDILTNNLAQRGEELGIDIKEPRRILVLYVDSHKTAAIENLIKSHLRQLFRTILLFNSSNYLVGAFLPLENERIKKKLDTLIQRFSKKEVRISGGIGPDCHSNKSIHRDYAKAKKALVISRQRRESYITFYGELGLELIVDSIPLQNKQEFVQKVFMNIPEKDMAESITYLKTFYYYEGSLKMASESLHIHPNTLQYHLNKIKDCAGFDPRSYKHASLFQIAILFYETINIF